MERKGIKLLLKHISMQLRNHTHVSNWKVRSLYKRMWLVVGTKVRQHLIRFSYTSNLYRTANGQGNESQFTICLWKSKETFFNVKVRQKPLLRSYNFYIGSVCCFDSILVILKLSSERKEHFLRFWTIKKSLRMKKKNWTDYVIFYLLRV